MGASVTDVGLATGCAALAALAGQYVFGRAVDRKGSISVQVLTSLAIAAVPLPWIWSGRPWQAAALMGAAGFFWAGYNLANFNLLLELTPDRLRARATAVYVTVVMAGNMIGPLIGGAIVESAGFRPVFVLTSVGRMAGALIFGVGVWISYRAARAAGRQRPGKASSPGPTS
jgi:MFS family permease